MTLSLPASVTLDWRLPQHAEALFKALLKALFKALFEVMCDTSLHRFVDTVHRPMEELQ